MAQRIQTTRRGLFKGLIKKGEPESADFSRLRPPGALTGQVFISACDRCDKCLSACPEQVIVKGDGGFPELDFSQRGCSGCSKCIAACPTGALQVQASIWPLGELVLAGTCLPLKDVTCQSCKDACDYQAISFPITQKTPVPNIENSQCTGCGECVSTCPVDAISIVPLNKFAAIAAGT